MNKILVVIMVLSLTLGITGSVSAWPPNLPPYDECHALVIGISDYIGEEYDDPYGAGAVSDAGCFRNGLRETWGMFASITLLTDRQATEAGIDAAFASIFNGAGPNDLAIVYWSGHSSDGLLGTWDRQAYSGATLAAKIEAINATKIVILDCCHAGEFAGVLDLPNTVVLLSCESDEGEYLYQYTSFSPFFPKFGFAFSHYVNQHPDVNGDGVVTIEGVFAYASPRTTALAAQYGESQHPIMIDNVLGDVAYLDSWG